MASFKLKYKDNGYVQLTDEDPQVLITIPFASLPDYNNALDSVFLLSYTLIYKYNGRNTDMIQGKLIGVLRSDAIDCAINSNVDTVFQGRDGAENELDPSYFKQIGAEFRDVTGGVELDLIVETVTDVELLGPTFPIDVIIDFEILIN